MINRIPGFVILLTLFVIMISAGLCFSKAEGAIKLTPQDSMLTCRISSAKAVYKVGKKPDIKVDIHNNSNSSIYLVGSLDASDCRWRYPHCYFKVVCPNGQECGVGGARCGNTNGLRLKDFVQVEPDGHFDPYQQIDDHGFFQSSQLQEHNFKEPGRYKFQFFYSTESSNIGEWHGNFPVGGDASGELANYFSLVPKTSIASNEIEIVFTK